MEDLTSASLLVSSVDDYRKACGCRQWSRTALRESSYSYKIVTFGIYQKSL